MMKAIHNPDVLSCLANLSNDEVFTPPSLANAMLDLLPQTLFASKETRFLDPCAKSGVFLREIAKRLMTGLKEQIPDKQERINHIFTKQLFGIAITELTGLLSRRSVYCSKTANGRYSVCTKFQDEEGNIKFLRTKHTWKDGQCTFCGASRAKYDRDEALESHAYTFIHGEEVFKMQFDVIIGNPPYQLSDGGNGASAKAIYHLFVETAKKLLPRYITMVIPARWYSGGKGVGLDEFRDNMLSDNRISHLIDFANSGDCFPGVTIAGGVCYFLWERDYHGICNVVNKTNQQTHSTDRFLNEFDIFVRNNLAVEMIRKIVAHSNCFLTKSVKSYSYFAVRSFERGEEIKDRINDVILLSSAGKGWYHKDKIVDKDKILNKYKVVITYAMSGGNKPSSEGNYQVISSLQTLKPNEICTETYLILGTFDNEKEAKNMESYVKTKFFRFLLLQALTSIHITRDSFCFVPMQDFSKSWTDEELYAKYGLTDEEIDFINQMIRSME